MVFHICLQKTFISAIHLFTNTTLEVEIVYIRSSSITSEYLEVSPGTLAGIKLLKKQIGSCEQRSSLLL
jgi:hypothetical protein